MDKLDAMRKRAAVLFPQGLMANSPTEPIVDARGVWAVAGQMFVGDVAGRRILRVMVEKAKGQYQACVKFIDGSGRVAVVNWLWSRRKCFVCGADLSGLGWPTEGLQRIVFHDTPPRCTA